MSERILTKEEESLVLERNLEKWKDWLHKTCPVSVNNPAKLWHLLESNEIMSEDLEKLIEIDLVFATSGRSLETISTYRASKALKLLREIGVLSTPAIGSRPYYFTS